MRIFHNPKERRKAILTTPESVKMLLMTNQAGVYSLGVEDGYEPEDFMTKFMLSDTAALLDMELNHYQWEGAPSLYYDFELECALKGIDLKRADDSQKEYMSFDCDMSYWIGYMYRLTHFKTAADSVEILKLMPVRTMMYAYPTGHCEDPDGWIESYFLKNHFDKYLEYFAHQNIEQSKEY